MYVCMSSFLGTASTDFARNLSFQIFFADFIGWDTS